MGKPEEKVENYLMRKVRAAGGLCYKFTSPGHIGVPDRICILNGHVVFVELKRDDGKGKLSELQKRTIAAMQAQGADVRVIGVNYKEIVNNLIEELTT